MSDCGKCLSTSRTWSISHRLPCAISRMLCVDRTLPLLPFLWKFQLKINKYIRMNRAVDILHVYIILLQSLYLFCSTFVSIVPIDVSMFCVGLWQPIMFINNNADWECSRSNMCGYERFGCGRTIRVFDIVIWMSCGVLFESEDVVGLRFEWRIESAIRCLPTVASLS